MEAFYYSNPALDLFQIIFPIIFLIIICMLVANATKGISQWSSNNKQPILDVNCKVVSKRMDVSRQAGLNDADGVYHNGGTFTTYYVTFQFESNNRIEFLVSGDEYGSIAENDYGKLRFQGTRFLGFTRFA